MNIEKAEKKIDHEVIDETCVDNDIKGLSIIYMNLFSSDRAKKEVSQRNIMNHLFSEGVIGDSSHLASLLNKHGAAIYLLGKDEIVEKTETLSELLSKNDFNNWLSRTLETGLKDGYIEESKTMLETIHTMDLGKNSNSNGSEFDFLINFDESHQESLGQSFETSPVFSNKIRINISAILPVKEDIIDFIISNKHMIDLRIGYDNFFKWDIATHSGVEGLVRLLSACDKETLEENIMNISTNNEQDIGIFHGLCILIEAGFVDGLLSSKVIGYISTISLFHYLMSKDEHDKSKRHHVSLYKKSTILNNLCLTMSAVSTMRDSHERIQHLSHGIIKLNEFIDCARE